MSRSNCDKPFYVDVGTSIVAIRCASNRDVIVEYAYEIHSLILQFAKKLCDRMNKEAEIGRPRRNCDVGTEREQSKRFDAYCYAHRTIDYGCGNCPLLDSVCCEFAWGQLPYEEGEAK